MNRIRAYLYSSAREAGMLVSFNVFDEYGFTFVILLCNSEETTLN